MVHPYTRLFSGNAVAPTVDEDIDAGYEVGDIWIDETGGASYQALDVSAGAAVWEEITGGGGSPDWGDIGGTLADQTDLQSALDDKADLTYVDALIAANDAMVYKGVIDCSANPNYPAADAGHAYKISVAGKIGGASGINVEVGDLILCTVDASASGNQATVGANWDVVQVNLDGAVIGPSSASDNYIVVFDGASGKLVKLGSNTIAQLLLGAQIQAASSDNDLAGNDQFVVLRVGGTTVRITVDDFVAQLLNSFSAVAHNHDGDETVQLVQANTHQSPDTDSAASSLHHTLGGSATQALPGDVWIAGTGTWSYTSADSPTFVASVPDADAAKMDVGWRLKITQTSAKYFIVTAKGSPSGGFTPVTIYGGTDYTLANAAISSPFYSPAKAPLGFPLDPSKWTVKVTDTSDRTQATPTATTWYNIGSLTISIPIGCWKVSYKVVQRVADASVALINQYSTLSTANNSESDAELTHLSALGGSAGALVLTNTAFEEKVITVAAKTSYYLNAKTTLSSIDSIAHRGDAGTTIIQAVCAYL